METKNYNQQSLERNGKQVHSLVDSTNSDEGGLDFGQLLAALRRRLIVVVSVTIAVAAGTVLYARTKPTKYESKFEILITPVTVENQLLSSVPQSLDASKKGDSSDSGIDDTELRVLQSPQLMSPIIKQIAARYPGTDSLDLNLKPIDKTNILEVSYQDLNPEKVQFVLETVAQAYLAHGLEERQEDIKSGLQFVDGQLPQLKGRVVTLQDRLQKFRQQYDLIDPESQGKQLSQELNQTVQQRLEIQSQLAKANALHSTLQNQLAIQPEQAVASAALSEAPRYQALLNRLQELESEIAAKSSLYTKDNPVIQDLRAQRQSLIPLVQQEAQRILAKKQSSTIADPRSLATPNTIRFQQTQQFLDTERAINVLQAQDKALAKEEDLLRQQAKQFPLLAGQNDDLERQLKIAVDNLNQFLTKRAALQIEAAQKQKPWQLLTPPDKPKHASSSIKLYLVLGTILGALLGSGLALVIDKFTNIFYSSEDIKNETRFPIIGEIPHQQKSVSHFWESLNSLYANIRFLCFDRSVRSLAVISATVGDGRSMLAISLAQTAAAMGHQVLLVDADLRCPQLHTILSLPNRKGLSNVIAEKLNFREIIQEAPSVNMRFQNSRPRVAVSRRTRELPKEASFSVLTAGDIPPNPTTLLSSQEMQNLAEQFQTDFDLVIYDTSPSLNYADSSFIATYTDASIFVVGLGKTNRSAFLRALEALRISCPPILGIVVNQIKR